MSRNLSDLDRFQKRLVDLRRQCDLEQGDLAKKFGVSVQTIEHWETGYSQPSILMLMRLSDYYQISLDDLLGLERKEQKVLC